MNEFTKSKLIDLFWEGIADTPWDVWCDTSSGDKERIVPAAVVELGIDVDIDEAYDLFWEWAEGLDEDSFRSAYSESLQEALPSAGYRVVLADYESDDFDINVEFGFQDPDESDVTDLEYLLKPGQTRGDLVVYLSDRCGYTSIYVHDERPATANDIKRLSTSTFPTMDTGEEYVYYGDID
jgi:hypothetical protein